MSYQFFGKMMCYGSLSYMPLFFMIEDVCIGLKKSASQKANNLQCIKAKMLKWTGKEAHAWISDIFCLIMHCNIACLTIGL